MIIRTKRKNIIKPEEDNNILVQPITFNDEQKVLKSLKNENKKQHKKSASIVVEEPVVVEKKVEDEDLSKWLEEHTED